MKITLTKLRSLSAPVRAQIAFGVAIVFAGSIGAVWLTTLGSRFEDAPSVTEVVTKEVVEKKEDGSSIGDFFSTAKNQIGSVFSAFASIKIELGEDDGTQYIEEEEVDETTSLNASTTPVSSVNASATTTATTSSSVGVKAVIVGTSTMKKAE